MSSYQCRKSYCGDKMVVRSSYLHYGISYTGLDIKHLAYMPVGHMVLKIYMPCENFYVPSQYLYKPCKAYVYCWENKYMPRLKNHLPSWAHHHKSLGALGQDLRAQGMRARLNVEPCYTGKMTSLYWFSPLILCKYGTGTTVLWIIVVHRKSIKNLSDFEQSAGDGIS